MKLQDLHTENASLRRAVAELKVLNDIAREIGALTDLDEVMQRIISQSIKAVEAEQGVITLVASESPEAGRTLVRTMTSSSDRQPFHLDDSVIGWMQLHQKPLMIDDPRTDKRFKAGGWDEHVRSVLSVPLLARSRLIGVLTVYNKRGEAPFGSADQRLLSIIAMQSAQVIENARLYEEEKALVRMQNELRTAFDIQANLLPRVDPVLARFDIAGATKPAREVGGDFYDYLPLGDRQIGLCVGDVSGKGLPAALLMASALATIRSYVGRYPSPADAMVEINRELYRTIKRGNFLTLFYAELDAEAGLLRYVNAGHNRPLLLGADGSVQELGKGGVALGIVQNASYEQGTAELKPGNVLAIYSDGVTEAMTPSREQYGEERFLKQIQHHSETSAADIVNHIVGSVERFGTGAGQSDDITVLVVKRVAND